MMKRKPTPYCSPNPGCNQHHTTGKSAVLFFSLLLSWFLFFFDRPLAALDPNKPFALFKVDNWSLIEQGTSDFVRAIGQTADGYLWIGTSKGLLRFDGTRFVKTRHQAVPGEENIDVQALSVDHNGSLWIGSPRGLERIENNALLPAVIDNSLNGKDIGCLAADNTGNIWIGYYDSPFLTALKDSKTRVYNRDNPFEIRGLPVIVPDKDNNLWIGSSESGLFRLENEALVRFKLTVLQGKYLIYSAIEDSRGNLWVGTNKGLVRVGIETGEQNIFTSSQGLSSNIVVKVMEDSDGNIYAGTMKGINRLKINPTGQEVIAIESQLKTEVIRSIFEDKEQNLWIGTQGSGLYRLRDHPFTTYSSQDGLLSDYIGGLAVDKAGTIWIGTVGGLNFFNPQTGKISSISGNEGILRNEVSRAFKEDREGNMWIGTENGIFVVPPGIHENIQEKYLRHIDSNDGLIGEVIRVLLFDHQWNLWIGSLKGVSILNQGNGRILSYPIAHDRIYSSVYDIYEDRNFDIWICTNQGLICLPGGRFEQEQEYLKGIAVHSISQDEEGVYWITTGGNGLIRLQAGKFFSYKLEHGLYSETIYQLLEDSLGYAWIAGKEGILRVRKHDLNEVAGGKLDILSTRIYDLDDGLLTLECNRFGKNGSCKTPNGEFWFATNKGVSVVHPAHLEAQPPLSPVLIEEITVDGRAITIPPGGTSPAAGSKSSTQPAAPANSSSKNIFWDSKDIQVRFTSPTFIKPGKLCFQFRLDGFDKDWLSVVPYQERVVNYTDLPAGKYTFRISVCGDLEDYGQWDVEETQFSFEFKTSIVHTVLFKILGAVIILLLVLATYFKLTMAKKK